MSINTNQQSLDGSKNVVLVRGTQGELLMDIRGNLSDGIAAALNIQFKERNQRDFTYIGDFSNINTSRQRNPSPVRPSFLEKPALEDITSGNVKGENGKSPIQIVDAIVDAMSDAEARGQRVVLRVIDEDNFRRSGVAEILSEAVALRKEQVEYIVAAANPEEDDETDTSEDTTTDDGDGNSGDDENTDTTGDEGGNPDDTASDNSDSSVPDDNSDTEPDKKDDKPDEEKTPAAEAYQTLKVMCACYDIPFITVTGL